MPPLSIADFVDGIGRRGLMLRVSGEQNDKLVLLGPQEARTDKIRSFLRAHKMQIIKHLIAPDRVAACGPAFVYSDDDYGANSSQESSKLSDELPLDDTSPSSLPAVPPVEDAPEFEDMPEIAEAVRRTYIAARAGRLPVERVWLGPGRSCENPNTYIVRCMERIESARRSLPPISWATYLDNLLMETTGVVAVALWWDGQRRFQHGLGALKELRSANLADEEQAA